MANNKLPKLRRDLNFNFFQQDGNDFVLISDPHKIIDEPIAVHYNFFLILNILNSGLTEEEFISTIKELPVFNNEIDFILLQINRLNELFFLESSLYFQKKIELDKQYLELEVRPAVCKGNSYPENPEEFNKYISQFFKNANSIETDIPKGLIVPHIDFNLGELSQEVYGKTYNYLRNSDADLFVIFGTSHYAYSDFFMLSRKSFETPLGNVEVDIDLLDKINNELSYNLTIDEFAHRPEHSIEFQVVLLKYLFPNRNFKILPILVGSFYEFIQNNNEPKSNNKINEFIENFEKIVNEHCKNVAYIASVDFAHIGRKFNDDFDAEEKLDELKIVDGDLIEKIIELDVDEFFSDISEVNDKWKVCGTSPIYTLLKTINFKEAKFIDYRQWNEFETKSAVSFAGFALF